LRMPRKSEIATTAEERHDGFRSGALIVSTYLFQGIIGLGLTALLGLVFFPDLFKASGLLLPLGYGQGPGQAGNIGNMFETSFGFSGGGAFGLAIATMGFLWACIGGIVYLFFISRKGKAKNTQNAGPAALAQAEPVEEEGEIPLTEAIDKFTVQGALVLAVYLATFLLSWGLTTLLSDVPSLASLAKTLVPLIWGFNFLIGSMLALALKGAFALMQKGKLMSRKYTNNYMLNRISGVSFDLMIIASVCAIDISDLSGLWVPFIVITTVGGFATLFYIHMAAKKLYPKYEKEGMLSMYGMLTGTVSTGIILLREVDPNFKTPAANNLVVGSSSAILLGFPFLLLVGVAPRSDGWLLATLGIMLLYFAVLCYFLFIKKARKLKEVKQNVLKK